MQTTNLRRCLPICLLPLLVTGCAQDAGSGTTPGSEIDVSVAVADLELGALDGTGPDVFSRITGLATDSAGRIFVLDYSSSEIRVFGPEGGHLFTFGGKGSGPGRLDSPCCLAWGPDDLLWVRDGGNSRYSAFAITEGDAEFVETRQMAHTDYNYLVPLTFTSAGELIDIGKQTSPEGESRITLFTLSGNSEVAGTVALDNPPPDELGMHVIRSPGLVRYFYRPFPPRRLLTFGPDGERATGIGSSYAIEWLRGSDTIHIESNADSPALTSDEKADGEEQLKEDAERAGIAVGAFPYGVPDRKPPLWAITLDDADRLWVLLSRAEGAPQIAEIWSTDGEMVAKVEVPADIRLTPPAVLGENIGLAVRRDSLGVESVVRLRY